VAVMSLVREGARRSYARQSVTARMKPRPAHDMITYMPSRRLTQTTAIIQPPVAGEWKDSEIGLIRNLIARWRSVVKPMW